MTEMAAANETGCCPRFDPNPWDEKEVEFVDKLFIKDRVRSFLHVPLNFGKVMIRCMTKIQDAGAEATEMLILCDENSLWGADVYVAVGKEVAAANTVRLSGRYLTKVFEGPFKDVRKWCAEMKQYVQDKGKPFKKMLSYYTTCPKCAKSYGKNYVVLFAEIQGSAQE